MPDPSRDVATHLRPARGGEESQSVRHTGLSCCFKTRGEHMETRSRPRMARASTYLVALYEHRTGDTTGAGLHEVIAPDAVHSMFISNPTDMLDATR
jgi:hypothetical protein